MNIGRLKSAESVIEKTPTKTYNTEFPIVGIGASAGGLEALEQFFWNMPKDSGMAFVVIQHLSPTAESFLTVLLQRVTQLMVQEVTDRMRIKPNCVYVIPPNKSMSILNGTLHLFALIESHGRDLPIDSFFRSLAFDRNEKSIGIILSGMGSDGYLGVKAIKEENGIVLVQDPASAECDSMPLSAINAVIVDVVAAASELPAKLIDLLKYIPTVNIDFNIDIENSSNLDKILTLLREQTGNDFSLYKKKTLLRRIERRRVIQRLDNIHSYVCFLQKNSKEVETLFKELLIGITSFFRDSAVWEMLKESVLPALIDELPDGYVMRAWVTGCSTGEEAYSLAIVFSEALEKAKKNKNLSMQIFASDIEQDAIEIARKGVYFSNIVADVSPNRINRFFTLEVDGYHVNPLIRGMVIFATHNVIKDPPFMRLDILTCRNMLIYMEPELQIKLYTRFNYSLNPGGIMILGIAESLRNQKQGFDEVEPKLKIFKRTVTTLMPEHHDFPNSFYSPKAVTTEFKIPPKTNENI
jgi:two-component system CheB/CheR fusion protein